MPQWRRPARLLAALLLLLGAGSGMLAQTTVQEAVAGNDPEFARLVKEWTTRPDFSSPLDRLAEDTWPTTKMRAQRIRDTSGGGCHQTVTPAGARWGEEPARRAVTKYMRACIDSRPPGRIHNGTGAEINFKHSSLHTRCSRSSLTVWAGETLRTRL